MTDDDRKIMSDLIRQAWDQGDPTAWFDIIYARAANGEGRIPWAYMQPEPRLMEWARQVKLNGSGKTALVVGCGLGDDAEALAEMGFEVTAFDVAPTAIAWARRRFPRSPVDYRVADLFLLPTAWRGAFEFVLESRTIQALPWNAAEPATEAIAATMRPGGQLLVLCHGREPHEPRKGIPWPLSREELALFEQVGLIEESFDEFKDGPVRRFRVAYRRKTAVNPAEETKQ
jgi:SAM-dependent methyltransferase